MRRRFAFGCMIVGMMALMLAMALSMFEYVATAPSRYSEYQRRLDVYGDVGVAEDELRLVQQDVASYIKGEADGMNREVSLFGVKQMMFNQRELDHMRDVRALFELERNVRTGAWLAAAALLILSALLTRKQWIRRNAFASLWALGAWLLLVLGLCAACGFNFDAAFIRFHELLFTNDLWLLDPATDAMIRMYPETFFMWMARDIGIAVGLGVLGIFALSMLGFLPERVTPEV